MKPSIQKADAMSLAIARACGIPTDMLRSIQYEHAVGDVATVRTEHYAWNADATEMGSIHQVWHPTIPDAD